MLGNVEAPADIHIELIEIVFERVTRTHLVKGKSPIRRKSIPAMYTSSEISLRKTVSERPKSNTVRALDRKLINQLGRVTSKRELAPCDVEEYKQYMIAVFEEQSRVAQERVAEREARRQAELAKCDELLQQARELYLHGEFKQAIEILTQIIELNPRHMHAYELRHRVNKRMGQHTEALNDFKSANSLKHERH